VPRRKVKSRIPREDFIGDSNADSYAIAIDPSGKLKWQLNGIDQEHVITILSERVSDDYLAFLQSKRVSYLFGGKNEHRSSQSVEEAQRRIRHKNAER
jgi:2,5-diamino-6-(ribosylamino)-4(3H)-pyrimidinone 5'-phosphate reductase